MGEGELSAEVIEKKKLIDNHYYAIANKARPPRTHSPRPIWTPPPSPYLDLGCIPTPHSAWPWGSRAFGPGLQPHVTEAATLGCNPM